jgi:hypothetical protein
MMMKQTPCATACALLLASPMLWAAIVTPMQEEPSPDGTGFVVPVALELSVDDQVAAMQFDVFFDKKIVALVSINAGPSAEAAQKMLTSALVEPGRSRVVIAGLNREVMHSGKVALLKFKTAGAGAGAVGSVELKDIKLADPYGASVSVKTANAAVGGRETRAGLQQENKRGVLAVLALALVAGVLGLLYAKRLRTRS